MYRVHLKVCLLGRDGVLGLSRWLSLPFVPLVGLDLFGVTADPDQPETVAVVGWDTDNQSFEIELLDCEAPEEPLSCLVSAYGPEWEVHQPEIVPLPRLNLFRVPDCPAQAQ
jgi:hypothetical protein